MQVIRQNAPQQFLTKTLPPSAVGRMLSKAPLPPAAETGPVDGASGIDFTSTDTSIRTTSSGVVAMMKDVGGETAMQVSMPPGLFSGPTTIKGTLGPNPQLTAETKTGAETNSMNVRLLDGNVIIESGTGDSNGPLVMLDLDTLSVGKASRPEQTEDGWVTKHQSTLLADGSRETVLDRHEHGFGAETYNIVSSSPDGKNKAANVYDNPFSGDVSVKKMNVTTDGGTTYVESSFLRDPLRDIPSSQY